MPHNHIESENSLVRTQKESFCVWQRWFHSLSPTTHLFSGRFFEHVFFTRPYLFFHCFFPGASRRSGGPTRPLCPFVGRFRSRPPFGSPRRRPRSRCLVPVANSFYRRRGIARFPVGRSPIVSAPSRLRIRATYDGIVTARTVARTR